MFGHQTILKYLSYLLSWNIQEIYSILNPELSSPHCARNCEHTMSPRIKAVGS